MVLILSLVVDPERLTPRIVQDRENGDVAWPICDIEHILKRHPSIRRRDRRVHMNLGIHVASLVNLENRPRLRCIVKEIPYLTYLRRLASRPSLAFQEARFGRT